MSGARYDFLALGALYAATYFMIDSNEHIDFDALKEYQRQAIQTKLEQMQPVEAENYIREKMKGREKLRSLQIQTQLNGRISDNGREYRVNDGLYLDIWAEQDTNGTFIDEYANYAVHDDKLEITTKSKAKRKFKKLSKMTIVAENKEAELQQKIDEMQKQINELNEQLSK